MQSHLLLIYGCLERRWWKNSVRGFKVDCLYTYTRITYTHLLFFTQPGKQMKPSMTQLYEYWEHDFGGFSEIPQNSFSTAWNLFLTSSSGMSFSILANVAAKDMCLVKSFEY